MLACATAEAILSDWTRALLRCAAARRRVLTLPDWRRAAALRAAGHSPYSAAAILIDGGPDA